MPSRVLIVLLLTMVLVIVGRASADAGKEQPVPGLWSENPSEQLAAFRQVLSERKQIIQRLIVIAQTSGIKSDADGPRAKAIRLLGTLRAEEAVEPLSRFITYAPRVNFIWEMMPREAYYVCAVALCDIGEPSVPAMLRKIDTSEDEEERNIAAWVIMQIEGKDQAAHRMSTLMETSKYDSRAHSRYLAAKDYILNYKPVFEPPKTLEKGTSQPQPK